MHILECAVIEQYQEWAKNGTPRISIAHLDHYEAMIHTYEALGLRNHKQIIDISYAIAIMSLGTDGVTAFGKHWSYENASN